MSSRPMLQQAYDSGVIDDVSGNFLPSISSPTRRGPVPFDFGDGSDTDEGEETNDKVEEIYR